MYFNLEIRDTHSIRKKNLSCVNCELNRSSPQIIIKRSFLCIVKDVTFPSNSH